MTYTAQEIIKLSVKIKDECVRAHRYDAAINMRNIENSFLNQYKEPYVEPTMENLISKLSFAVKSLPNDREFLISLFRNIRINMIIND